MVDTAFLSSGRSTEYLTEGVQFVFGNIKAATVLPVTVLRESEAFSTLRRLRSIFLFLIVTGDAVKNVADPVAIFTGVSQAQNTVIFAVLRYRQEAVLPQLV